MYQRFFSNIKLSLERSSLDSKDSKYPVRLIRVYDLLALYSMSTIYVDESQGSDTVGDGSQTSPFLTLGFALFANPANTVTALIRKGSTDEYQEPTQSALKKARKTADGLEKKRKKAEELAVKEVQKSAEDKEKREKLLVESKRVILEEDQTLPKALRVSSS